MSRTVVIVGRPNVGKSRLFNRLARRRISIVHDQPGITRDIVSTHIADGDYTLQDTGGLGLKGGDSSVATGLTTPAQLVAASEKQAAFAIDTATLILFLVDGLEGLTALDARIAARLRKHKTRVLLVVNKADFGEEKIDTSEAYRLGLGEPLFVSAEHGRGETALREAIAERLKAEDLKAEKQNPEEPPEETEGITTHAPTSGAAAPTENRKLKTENSGGVPPPLCVCFIGRPNVGKSSLSNRLLKSDRLIVSEIPGTTRDAVTLDFKFRGRDNKLHPFRLIDTAGIKAAAKLASPVEYFSRLRSLDAIKETDIVFLVLDALDGVTQQDKAIAGEAIKEHKPIIVVVNKWDLVQKAFAAASGDKVFSSQFSVSSSQTNASTNAGAAAPTENRKLKTENYHGGEAAVVRKYKNERDYREKYERAVFEHLYFTPGAPLIYVSATSGYEVSRMLNAAVKLHRTLDKKIPTAPLNKLLLHLTERTPPPAIGGRRFRIYYATQTGTRPFRVKLFCNREGSLSESYRRYLEAGVVEKFDLHGCPVYFDLVGKGPNPYQHADNTPEKEAHYARINRNKTRRPAATTRDDDQPFQPFETVED